MPTSEEGPRTWDLQSSSQGSPRQAVPVCQALGGSWVMGLSVLKLGKSHANWMTLSLFHGHMPRSCKRYALEMGFKATPCLTPRLPLLPILPHLATSYLVSGYLYDISQSPHTPNTTTTTTRKNLFPLNQWQTPTPLSCL